MTYSDKISAHLAHFPKSAKRVIADTYSAVPSVSSVSTKVAVCPIGSVPGASAASSSSNAFSFETQANSIATYVPFQSTATPATSATLRPERPRETPYSTAEIFKLPFEPSPREGYFLVGVDECKKYWYLLFENAAGEQEGKFVEKCIP